MTTVAFVHDHCFFEADGRYYSSGKITTETWQRYLGAFDHVVVIATSADLSSPDAVKNYSIASTDDVVFRTLPRRSGIAKILDYRNHKNHIRSVLSNVDAVVVRLPSYFGMIALREANKLGIPTGVEIVGCPFDAYRTHGSLVAYLLAPFAYLHMYLAIKMLPQVAVYVTSDFLQQRYPTKTSNSFVASNVELHACSTWLEVENERRIRWEDRQFGDPIKIGFIGSLSAKYKGLQDLIEALSKVSFSFRLIVLGEGDIKAFEALAEKAKISTSIEFVKPLPGGAPVNAWLRSLDLYCQPSHTEGLPRALIEAMACGLVAIGSTAGGIPELLEENFLFKPKDVVALRNRLIYFSKLNTVEYIDACKANFDRSCLYSNKNLIQIRDFAWKRLADIARSKKNKKTSHN